MLSYKSVFSISGLFLVLIFSSIFCATETIIDEVLFQQNDDASESVIFHLSAAVSPKSFTLKGEKPRVVFDFLDTGLLKTLPSVIAAKGQLVEKIRIGRHSDKTRVVLDIALAAAVNSEENFDNDSNTLTITLFSRAYPPKDVPVVVEPVAEVVVETPREESVTKATKEEKTVVAIAAVEPVVTGEKVSQVEDVVDIVPLGEADSANQKALLSEVRFENTSNKGEMVLFKLNGFFPPEVSGQEKGNPKVTCVFSETMLDPQLEKTQNPGGKFIRKIVIEKENENAPISVYLELVPNKNYDLQQVFFKEDNLFVIIVNSYDSMAVSAE